MMHVQKHLNRSLIWVLILITAMLIIALSYGHFRNSNSMKSVISESNYAFVNYPVFHNIENAERINSVIFDKAQSIVKSDEQIDGVVNYRIIRFDSSILSIEFKGDIVYLSANKPFRIYSCISIDLKKGEQIKLNDVCNIDDEFAELCLKAMYERYQEINPSCQYNPFDGETYTVEYIYFFLSKADQPTYSELLDRNIDSQVKSCLIDEKVIISLELSQAYGYHIEIEIPLNSNANHSYL